MAADEPRFLARLRDRLAGRFRRPARGVVAPELPLLAHVAAPDSAEATAWLRASLTTFGERVASFVPGHFEAYARVLHPLALDPGDPGDPGDAAPPTWRALAAAAGVDLAAPGALDAMLDAVAWSPEARARAEVGSLPPAALAPLVEHLAPATATPDRCHFAVWEGFGASAVPRALAPTLALPHRRYHVFAGPIDAALTSFSAVPAFHQSANLWWPADRAWCVATEVDLAWTYVGGTRACVGALPGDPRLEASETRASAFR